MQTKHTASSIAIRLYENTERMLSGAQGYEAFHAEQLVIWATAESMACHERDRLAGMLRDGLRCDIVEMSPEQIAILAELVRCNGTHEVMRQLRSAMAEARSHARDIGDSALAREIGAIDRHPCMRAFTVATALIASALDIASDS